MSFKFYSTITTISSLVFLVACNNSSGDNKRQKTISPASDEEFSKASCDVQPHLGEAVNFSAGQHENIRALAFGRKIDISKVNAVGKASISSSIEFFLNDPKVQMVKTEKASKKSCTLMASLPLYKNFDQYEKIWSDVNGSITKGTLLGLYMPQEPGVLGLTEKSALFVREDTGKWTLIHEYMHHLFEVYEREKENNYSYQVRDRYFEASDNFKIHYEEYEKTKQATPELIDSIVMFLKRNREYRLSYPLEEMAIESYLLNLKSVGNLRNTTSLDDDSAKRYIETNADKAITTINDLTDLAVAAQSFNMRVKELKQEEVLLEKMMLEVKKIKNNFPVSKKSLSFLNSNEPHSHVGCSHAVDFEKYPIPKL